MDIERLYREHARALYRYVVSFTGSPDVAEDVVQETFIRLMERKPTDTAIRGWLFQVATNLSRDAHRRDVRHARLLAEAPHDATQGDAPAETSAAALAEDARLVATSALRALPERDRTVLLMREEGFSHAEIARAVGTTEKSVGTFIARAMTRLATILDERKVT